MLVCNIFEFSFLYSLRFHFVHIFTSEPQVVKFTNEAIWIVLVVISLDFVQGSLNGTIKALSKQNPAMYINFVTYYVIVIPLAVYFTFNKNLAIHGIWLAFICGMIHQISAYLVLI